ncbi:hypothetical protein NPA31_011900 [Aurantimonas sp. MSK8Z-1]|uniref:hypothetical protein n=1 Tax=Mangrovibrevibacter kandeliae TaxID=2968473 RepID=UPI002119021C|nr:hypothetical protein [Aurantimonas sp. MSK8Z-1]MCW4115667.1 hypothetical protein [Aurantimonas sp. MSK8Z-1]
MGAIANTTTILAAAVANGGTLTLPYPAGTSQAILNGTSGGQVAVDGGRYAQAASGAGTVAIAYGASNITVTNNSGVTWPSGATLRASFGRTDRNGTYNLTVGTDRLQAAAGDGSNPNYVKV